jgi:hypothetical protein
LRGARCPSRTRLLSPSARVALCVARTSRNNFPHESVECYHIEIGAPIDSTVTSIARPRAVDYLPEPPARRQFPKMFAKAVELVAFPETAGRADR